MPNHLSTHLFLQTSLPPLTLFTPLTLPPLPLLLLSLHTSLLFSHFFLPSLSFPHFFTSFYTLLKLLLPFTSFTPLSPLPSLSLLFTPSPFHSPLLSLFTLHSTLFHFLLSPPLFSLSHFTHFS